MIHYHFLSFKMLKTRAYAFDSTKNFVLSKSELLSNFHPFTSWLSACPPPETLCSSQSLPCRSSLLRMLQENSPPCWAPFCSATNFLAGCQRSLRWELCIRLKFVCKPGRIIYLSIKEGGVGMNWTVTTVPLWGRVRTHCADGVSQSLTSPTHFRFNTQSDFVSAMKTCVILPSAPEAKVRPSIDSESTVTELVWPSIMVAVKLSAVTETSLGGDLREKWEMAPDWQPT